MSLFTASNTPAQTNLNDGSPLEVGVKFTSSVAGQITALKFYRSASDTGSDLLDLWTSTGTKLASATFTNTAASGWQTVTLATPVSIAANTTYVASYHTTGAYVATNNFFTTAVTSGVLTAPSTTTAGGNGVYAYGGTSTAGIFPTNTFSAANYWADVVFASSAPNTPPTAVADTADATEKGGIANGSGGSPATGNVLTNDTDPDAGDTKTVTAVSFGATAGTLGTALTGAHGSLVLNAAGTFTYTVNETDAAVQALRLSTNTLTDVFNYTMRDTAGATSSTTLTVTIHGANDAPVLAAQTASQNAIVGSAFSLPLPAGTFTDVDAGDTLTYTATAADGSPLPTWLTFNAATRTFSGTPAAADRRHAQRQGLGHRSRRPRRQRDLQYRRDDDAKHAADGCRRHGRRHREGRHCQRLRRLAGHRQRPHQRHRSRCRRHQDRHRGQLRRGGRHAWHSA